MVVVVLLLSLHPSIVVVAGEAGCIEMCFASHNSVRPPSSQSDSDKQSARRVGLSFELC